MKLHRMVAIVVAAALTAGPACGASGNDSSRGDGDGGTSILPPERVLTGVVIHVEARGLEDVESFTLRSEGRTFEIFLDPEAEYSFPPGHLRSHMAGGEPVEVEVRALGGRLVATSLADAE